MNLKRLKLTKKIFLISIALLLTLTGCSFGKDKPSVLFNINPITKETIMDNSVVFAPGQRIYYVVLMPKPQESRFLYIQVIKQDSKDERFGYDLIWSANIRLKDEEMYYYTDYVVLNQTGSYIMKVFSKDKPTEALTMAEFFIRE